MPYPGTHAKTHPDKAAVIMAGSGDRMSFLELDHSSNQIAHLLRSLGLGVGDHISLFMENRLEFFQVSWACIRSGLQLTPINRYLTAEEAAYIVNDTGSKALIASGALMDQVRQLPKLCRQCDHFLMLDGTADGWQALEPLMAQQATEALHDETLGEAMMYSSGTTGKPKGVKRPLTGLPAETGPFITETLKLFGFDLDCVYLSPAPLYHAAPYHYSSGVLALGGTVVVLEKFDAIEALRAIETYKVTHSQWVPTMFVRMMKLPEKDRLGWDLSSHQLAIHAAAPCPVPIKRQMIEWWGPILLEYYAGSEANGVTLIGSEEWLSHPGSVGRAIQSVVRICDEESNAEVPAGERGLVYFEQEGEATPTFEYHNDKDKTRSAQHPDHPNWTTLGDLGYVDEEGYLYLTDRKAYTIISGGINIYPQEIEDTIILHEKVTDVAVFGIPNEDFGEEVKAVVQAAEGCEPGPELEQEIIAWTAERLAKYKVPRSVDFEAELPRLPTGKLYKRLLRDRYWGKTDSRIV